MKNDALGNRMKNYEKVSSYQLYHRIPVIIRVDGKSFHSLKLEKPFDDKFMFSMVNAAKYTAEEMQGFKLAYIQSDEVSFILSDFDSINTEAWFDYDLSKIISISASIMTQFFVEFGIKGVFDSRAFNIPENDVPNYLLWRNKDWCINSLQTYCRKFFSHKQLNLKKKEDMHEMLYSVGKNWTTDLTDMERNGTFLYKKDRFIVTKHISDIPTYELIKEIVDTAFSIKE